MAPPDLQDALNALQRRDLDTAISTLEDTVDTLPAHPTAHVLLARAYETRERWADALTHWARAQVLLPNSPVAQEGKARVIRKMDAEAKPEGIPTLLDVIDASDLALPDDGPPPEETDEPTGGAPEGLTELRQRADEEARRGGARSGLPDTPEERVDTLADDAPDDDLDHLINELESARIDPDPDATDAPEPDLEDDEADDLVSETLARIYKQQGQYGEAARVYEKLADQQPDRADAFRTQAAEMREQAENIDASDSDA
jgi:tetratricopeptide (TPR) repeat protein